PSRPGGQVAFAWGVADPRTSLSLHDDGTPNTTTGPGCVVVQVARPAGSPPPGPAGSFTDVIYLDAVSTEPLHPAARETLLAALDTGYADPLRLHGPGRNARLLLDNAREVVAACLGARPDEVTFTPSGTAAVHLGLLGLALGRA